jgi:membrane protease YdiL (CAAX protease family)
MKPCHYCGRENQVESFFCQECGTTFEEEKITPPPLPRVETETELNARTATLILVFYIVAQFGAGIVGGSVGASVLRMVKGPETGLPEIMQTVTPPTYAFAFLAAAALMFAMCWTRFRHCLRDTSPIGAAWVIGEKKHVLQGLGVGVIAGLVYIGLALLVPRSQWAAATGPVAQMSVGGGISRLVWLGLALGAPFVEEPLFRGVLYAGYRRSFGAIRAALFTTSIFWALHLFEMAHFWPAMVGVAALGLISVWMRLRAQAIGASVALHLGYNGTLVVLAMCIN